MNISPAAIGFLRGLGYSVLAGIVSYVANNLGATGIFDPAVTGLVVAIAAAIEHQLTT
jgi:hypothetical protein